MSNLARGNNLILLLTKTKFLIGHVCDVVRNMFD